MDKLGSQYPWVYWVATVGAFVFLVIDILNDAAIWNYLTVACIVVAILLRPGGIRGPRAAAAKERAREPLS